MRARIVIIGTGTTGLCLALELARRTNPLSDPVLLVSAGETAPAELELCRYDLEVEALSLEARHGLRFWAGLWSATGRDPGWNPCGLTYAEVSTEGPPALKRMRELGASVHLEGGRVSDEDAGTLCTKKAAGSLEALAREAGAIVRKGEIAEGLVVEGGRVVGVKTSSGTISAGEVVLAGASAAALAPDGAPALSEKVWTEFAYDGEGRDCAEEGASGEELGLEDLFTTNDLNPEAAAAVFESHFEQESPSGSEVRAQASGDLVASPEQGGRLWVGGFEQSESAAEELARRTLGAANSSSRRSHGLWSTADERPIVGPLPSIEGVWIGCAFGEKTSLLAPACAESLSDLILAGESGWFNGGVCDPSRAAVSWSSRAR